MDILRCQKDKKPSPDSRKGIDTMSSKNTSSPRDKRASEGLLVDFEPLEELIALGESDRANNDQSRHLFNNLHSSKSSNSSQFLPLESQIVTFYSSSSKSTRRSSSIRQLFTSRDELRENFNSQDQNAVWWLDVQNPSEKALRALCYAFRVHPLTFEDIWMREPREKMESFHSYYFASFRSFHMVVKEAETRYELFNIYMIVFRDGTLTVSFTRNGHSSHVLDRIALVQDSISISRDWIFYAFVDDVVDSFEPPIKEIENKVNEIDDQIYITRMVDMTTTVLKIEEVRKRISTLQLLLNSKIEVLRAFDSHHRGDIPLQKDYSPWEDITLYMGDVQDHVITMKSNLHQFESILSRSKTTYLTQLMVDNVIHRQRIHKLVVRITAITIILSTMNLICGLFSTNVNANAPLYANNSLTPFAIVVSAEAVVAIILFLVAKKFSWF